MESVTIAAPFAYERQLSERLQALGATTTAAGGILVVDDGKSRVYITRNDAAHEEFEPERLELVRLTIPAPIFYSIDFSDISLCRRVLEVIADDPDLLVDNDHGVLLPGPEFIRVLRSQENWDWRTKQD